MKIILASGEFPPKVSGIARFSGRLAHGLESAGNTVEVITEGRGLRRVGRVAVLDDVGRAKIDKGGDILQVIGPTPLFTEQCVRLGQRRDLPVVYRLDAMPGLQTYYDNWLTRTVDWAYQRIGLYPTLRNIDCAVFTTVDLALNYGPYRVPYEVIRAEIDPCDCPIERGPDSQSDKDASRKGNGPSLLFVGQLRPYKGVRFLLRSLPLLEQMTGQTFSLTIAGEGPERGSLTRLTESLGLHNSVRFLGPVSDSDLHSLYRSHGILVLPSVCSESFGLVLVEARRHGMQVIGTNLPGVREVVRSLGGIVVPPKNPLALATGIVTLMKQDLAETNVFSLDLSSKGHEAELSSYLSLYSKLVSGSRPSDHLFSVSEPALANSH